MKTPKIMKNSSDHLDLLSEKAANLAKTSRKLGTLAGLSVVVLKSCTMLAYRVATLALQIGVSLINFVGSFVSKRCSEDLKKSPSTISRHALLLLKSPAESTRIFINGIKGVLANPTDPRFMMYDVLTRN